MTKKPLYAYIGTYTVENSKKNRNATGKGIYIYEISRETGEWKLCGIEETLCPAVLAFGKDQDYVYCVNSGRGEMTAYRRDAETGQLTELNRAETDGKNIMIMNISPDGRWIAAGDHKGILNIFRVNEDGTIGEKTEGFVLPGQKGPLNEKIQPWSRPHHVPFSPDGRFVLIADKGLDIVHSYRLDQETGKLSPVQALKCHGASCPRHLWWHPNRRWVYVNTEYTATIIACSYDQEQGTLAPFQVVSALPDTVFDVNTMTSELVVDPSGRFLYISNRRHNSLSAFRIDQETGRLTLVNNVDCGGVKPRFFAIEPGGKYLFCGNQMSDNLVLFRIDQESGALIPEGRELKTPCPVWILFTDTVPTAEQFGERKEVKA